MTPASASGYFLLIVLGKLIARKQAKVFTDKFIHSSQCSNKTTKGTMHFIITRQYTRMHSFCCLLIAARQPFAAQLLFSILVK